MSNPYDQQPYGQQPPYGPPPPPYGQQPPYGQPYGYPPQYAQHPGYPPPGYPPGYGYGMPGGDLHSIPDYKGWAIATIFIGGIILGVLAIMKSNEVGQYKMQGNAMMAQAASNSTKMLCLVGTILGGIGCLSGLIFLIVGLTM